MPLRSPLRMPGASVRRSVLPPSRKLLPPEHPAMWTVRDVVHEDVERGAPIAPDHIGADRDVFGRAAAGSRGEREERRAARPGGTGHTRKPWRPVLPPEILVTAQRHARLEVGHVPDGGEAVCPAERGRGGAAQQATELALLHRSRILARRERRGGGAHRREAAGSRRSWAAVRAAARSGKPAPPHPA